MTATHAADQGKSGALPLTATLGALGVVYGDIGTSPLYALKEAARAASHGGPLVPAAILGVVSLILWALILIISLKYALLIMRADNRGEGGIVALLALLSARNAQPGTWRAQLLIVGLIGAALLYGDGAITPAISVLSAIEGLKVDAPSLTPVVVPLTIVILIGLFVMQKQGTGFIGKIFGPVMLGWFGVLAAARHPRHRQGAGGAGRAEPALRLRIPDPPGFPHQLRHSRRGLPGRHRRRGDVCRHGPFRPQPDPARLVRGGAAGAGAELLWAGGAADHRSGRDRQSLLPARARLGALSAGCFRHARHGHRLAGDHIRRLFTHPAVDPARLPAAHAHHPHHQRRHRPDLRAAGELAAGGGNARRRDRFWHFGRAGRRLWHRGVAVDGDHHAAGRFGRDPVGLFAFDRDRGERVLPGDRLHLLRGEFHQTGRRRLVSAAAGGCGGFPDADLAQRRQAGRTRARQTAPAGRGFDRNRGQPLPRPATRHRGVPGLGAERRTAGADAVRQA